MLIETGTSTKITLSRGSYWARLGPSGLGPGSGTNRKAKVPSRAPIMLITQYTVMRVVAYQGISRNPGWGEVGNVGGGGSTVGQHSGFKRSFLDQRSPPLPPPALLAECPHVT